MISFSLSPTNTEKNKQFFKPLSGKSELASALKPLLPMITALAAFKGVSALSEFGGGFLGGFGGKGGGGGGASSPPGQQTGGSGGKGIVIVSY